MKSNAVVQEAPETVVAVLPKPSSVSPREEELENEVSEIEAMAQAVLAEFNLESTNGMPVSTYSKVMERVMEVLESCDTEPDNTGHEERSAE